MINRETLRKIDLEHIWHPFTPFQVWQEDTTFPIIEKAEGVELIDVNGKRYLDGVSSLWCNVHGHNVPKLVQAIKDQAEKICHSTCLGLSNRPLIELSEKLIKIIPKNLKRIFYSDSGSAAVEAALRMCLEYWQKQNSEAAKKKTKFLALEDAYHGDTLGAITVGYSKIFHKYLDSVLIPSLKVQPPHHYRFYHGKSEDEATSLSLKNLNDTLNAAGQNIAAMIIEPLVQGAAGIWTHSPEYLKEVSLLCKKYSVLLIVDEVASGFGKTGKMFALNYAAIEPDVMVIAKGLSAGYLPISAAIATEEIFKGFIAPAEELKTFFYGQTFAGNPLAAAVACANLDLFEENKVLENLTPKIDHFHQELEKKIAVLPHVAEIRKCGLMIGIELSSIPGKHQAYPIKNLIGQKIVQQARKLGAFIRPLGNVMVLMPALAMTKEDLSKLVEITALSIKEITGN